jgi:hypothetical protein
MLARCKVCGKPLHDPVSIARGMGPKCAGIFNSGKSFHSTSRISSGSSYSLVEGKHAAMNLFSFVEERQNRVPETLRRYPSDLVELVLSAPAAGSIASRVKLYSRRRKNNCKPTKLLKQIRRMCIEFRLLFWPGLSMNLQPIPCIPHGENDWKLGENGKVISRDELVAYLSRYGIISHEQLRTPTQMGAVQTSE